MSRKPSRPRRVPPVGRTEQMDAASLALLEADGFASYRVVRGKLVEVPSAPVPMVAVTRQARPRRPRHR